MYTCFNNVLLILQYMYQYIITSGQLHAQKTSEVRWIVLKAEFYMHVHVF